MTPAEAIAALERAVARNGQAVTLRRGPSSAPTATATLKAHVRSLDRSPDEIAGGITQDMTKVILSPTGLAATWPGVPDKGDWVVIDGTPRLVELSKPIRMADTLVRVELLVKGG